MIKSVSSTQVVHDCDHCGTTNTAAVGAIVHGNNAGKYTTFPPCTSCGSIRCNNCDTDPTKHPGYKKGAHSKEAVDHIHVEALEEVLRGSGNPAGVYAKHGVS